LDSFPFRSLDGFDFYFTVSEGFEYNVEFSTANYLLDSNKSDFPLFTIAFNRTIHSSLRKKDILSNLVSLRIRFTICKIIDQFIGHEKCSLLFICDSTDRLDKGRFSVFQEWEKEYKPKYEMIWKIIEDIDSGLIFYVGAIAFDNSHRDFLSNEMIAPFILSIDKE